MAQQHTLHFHSFTCVCYWYALHYNENISTRWIAVPLPLPSTWKDFVICLLWSDFVTHLCWVPDRCLLANFLIGLHWPHFAPAAFTGCFTPSYMRSNSVCLLLPPSRCTEVNPYSSCEVQCWEHTLGGKPPAHLIPLCSQSPATQQNEDANAEGCPGWKVPVWSPHLGTKGWEEGSWGSRGWQIALQHQQTERIWLVDWPKSATEKAHSAVSRLTSWQESTRNPFPPGSNASPQLDIMFLCTFEKATTTLQRFQVKTSLHPCPQKYFWTEKEDHIKEHFGAFNFESEVNFVSVRWDWRFTFCNTCGKHCCI